MSYRFLLIFLFGVFFKQMATAQTEKNHQELVTLHIQHAGLFGNSYIPPSLFSSTLSTVHLPPFSYRKTLDRGAVFCRFESTVNMKYNIWLKIRAGDIDSYHRMIEVKE
jgi:hypothetical protein